MTRGSSPKCSPTNDDEALYFEARGKDHGIVRFTFEMLESLTRVVEEKTKKKIRQARRTSKKRA